MRCARRDSPSASSKCSCNALLNAVHDFFGPPPRRRYRPADRDRRAKPCASNASFTLTTRSPASNTPPVVALIAAAAAASSAAMMSPRLISDTVRPAVSSSSVSPALLLLMLLLLLFIPLLLLLLPWPHANVVPHGDAAPSSGGLESLADDDDVGRCNAGTFFSSTTAAAVAAAATAMAPAPTAIAPAPPSSYRATNSLPVPQHLQRQVLAVGLVADELHGPRRQVVRVVVARLVVPAGRLGRREERPTSSRRLAAARPAP